MDLNLLIIVQELQRKSNINIKYNSDTSALSLITFIQCYNIENVVSR